MEEQKYFNQGDVVEVRQDIDNKPQMIVERVERTHIPDPSKKSPYISNGDKTKLVGIRCIWFDKNFTLQKHTFNTKDLKFVGD